MVRNMARIEFESRREVSELLDMITRYVEQNPEEKKNKILDEFYHLLDALEMYW